MSRRNVGVAIGLPEPYADELQAWRSRLGDPSARRIPPHVTLLPPTLVRDEAMDGVEEHLRSVSSSSTAFNIRLRGSATFRPLSPVVFVSLAEGISECERLEALVRSGPLARALRFPYHPHVTVAQDVDDASLERGFTALAGYEAFFRVWGFSLFEQGEDGVWRPQRDFPFGGGDPGPQTRPAATW